MSSNLSKTLVRLCMFGLCAACVAAAPATQPARLTPEQVHADEVVAQTKNAKVELQSATDKCVSGLAQTAAFRQATADLKAKEDKLLEVRSSKTAKIHERLAALNDVAKAKNAVEKMKADALSKDAVVVSAKVKYDHIAGQVEDAQASAYKANSARKKADEEATRDAAAVPITLNKIISDGQSYRGKRVKVLGHFVRLNEYSPHRLPLVIDWDAPGAITTEVVSPLQMAGTFDPSKAPRGESDFKQWIGVDFSSDDRQLFDSAFALRRELGSVIGDLKSGQPAILYGEVILLKGGTYGLVLDKIQPLRDAQP